VIARPLVLALLLVAPCGDARAEPAVAPLLKPLDLAGYPGRTTPPHFSGSTLDARRLAIEDLRGRVVLVNFWASWCAECRPEMPVFEQLHRELASKGLAVIGVNAREERAAIRRYAGELGLTFPLVLDPDGKINAAYGVVGLPTTFVVARDGQVVALAVGSRDWAGASARALFQALLAAPSPDSGVR
jgi:thiol-disulfide isomerase/thioredoxin